MLTVHVKSAKVIERHLPPTQKRPAGLTIREQQAAFTAPGQDFPQPFLVSLGQDGQAYAPGQYTIDPSCFAVNQYGGLELRRVRLVALGGKA